MSAPVRTRRHWLWATAAATTVAFTTPRLWAATATDTQLPLSTSLADELAAALARHQPLVVLVSLEGCVFCRAVRNSHLTPMRRQQQISAVQIDMRNPQATRDAQGVPTTHEALAQLWNIKVAPTVLFLGQGGVEVAERLSGAYLPDFYGAYLDERLAQAQRRIKA